MTDPDRGDSAPPPGPEAPDAPHASFERRGMVPWFHPVELLRTAFHVFFAETIAGYLDRRETQAGLPPVRLRPEGHPRDRWARFVEEPWSSFRWKSAPIDADLSTRREVWIDYVADVGEGWNPTYTVATLLARKRLHVKGLADPLPRADLLVFGGDAVYPTPASDGYEVRTLGPYRAANPKVAGGDGGGWDEAPLLVAVPGNHDWYDGLTGFLRHFCQGSWIGNWRTCQSRSYFAIRLPHDWWIWGTDIQLERRIDRAQLGYFEAVASERPGEGGLEPGHRVILCTAEASWIRNEDRDDGGLDNLAYFEDRIIRENGGILSLTLAGDLHHYSRWVDPYNRQRINTGGGGAYVRGTHNLPRAVSRNEAVGSERYPRRRSIRYEASDFPYPSRRLSRRLARGVLRFPFLRQNLLFCAFLGMFSAAVAWALGAAELPMGGRGAALLDHLAGVELAEVTSTISSYLSAMASALSERPGAVLLSVGLVAAWTAFARLGNRQGRRAPSLIWGALHGTAHLVLLVAVVWGVAVAGRWWMPAMGGDGVDNALFYLGIVLAVGLLGGLLVGFYLWISDRWFGWHTNEVFSAQGIPDYRSFLRMHIDEDGTMTIYPIAVDRVSRKWRRTLDPDAGESLFEPADREPVAHLIEGPIRI